MYTLPVCSLNGCFKSPLSTSQTLTVFVAAAAGDVLAVRRIGDRHDQARMSLKSEVETSTLFFRSQNRIIPLRVPAVIRCFPLERTPSFDTRVQVDRVVFLWL